MKQRPVNLDLTTIRFPLMAILSIFHRITGVLLLFAIGYLLYLLQLNLTEGPAAIQVLMQQWYGPLLIWVICSCLSYHVLAGVKHLLADIGIGDTLRSARVAAWILLVLALASFVLLGVWIW